jgi:multiple sugar transport system permease protein
MTSPSRITCNVMIYAGLSLGALITLAPFALGLMTSFTSTHQFVTGTPLQLPRPPTLSN